MGRSLGAWVDDWQLVGVRYTLVVVVAVFVSVDNGKSDQARAHFCN